MIYINNSIYIYVLLGILPSLVWLFYYLKKDLHPEPKKMIIKIFWWGALVTIPIFFVQIGLKSLLEQIDISSLAKQIIYWFLIISFTEELFKYLIIKIKVFNNPNLDEPVDIMIYMIVAALGFAAVENTLYLLAPTDGIPFDQLVTRTAIIEIVRFIGATFLHTLCSAVVGYSLVISFCEARGSSKKLAVAIGIITATVLHGLYDFSIITLDGPVRLVIPVVVIIMLAAMVLSEFKKVEKLKGICKIN